MACFTKQPAYYKYTGIPIRLFSKEVFLLLHFQVYSQHIQVFYNCWPRIIDQAVLYSGLEVYDSDTGLFSLAKKNIIRINGAFCNGRL